MYGTNGGLTGELSSCLGALNLSAGSISLELLDKNVSFLLFPLASEESHVNQPRFPLFCVICCFVLFFFHGHSVLYYLLPNVLFSFFFFNHTTVSSVRREPQIRKQSPHGRYEMREAALH